VKSLVTGASGFIGRRLARELVRRGDEVACLVRRTSRTAPLSCLPVELVVGDLGDPGSLDAAVKGRDRVFHLAGVVQALDEADFDTANTRGTANLVGACLRAAPGLKRFVFVSSIAAAGPGGPGRPVVETDAPKPVSAYGRSKLAAENAVRETGAGLPATIVRPPNVLGPGSKELAGAIGLLRRRLSPVIGDGRPRTSLVDVDDLVSALILAADHPRAVGETYFVTDGGSYAWPEIMAALAEELGIGRFKLGIPCGAQLLAAGLAEAACCITGRPPRLTREIVRAGRDHFWLYNGSKICRELGFRPLYDMRDSVRRAVAEDGASGRRAARRRPAAR
jgi:nucleoside-diphosphate-sugar epimerase